MSGQIQILRVSKAADEAEVSRLFEASYPPLMAVAYTRQQLAAALPVMTRAQPELLASGRFAVIERGEQAEASDAVSSPPMIVACGGYSLERPGRAGTVEPGVGHVRHFATHPSMTRAGLGRRIFGWCVDGARREGCHALECYASLNAVPFYRGMGLDVLRYQDVLLHDAIAFPVAVMRMRL